MMDARVPTALELAANVFNAASIVLAARNSLHTWWTGIVGCALFAVVFVGARLYADFTLQIFFIGACIVGWWTWARGSGGVERPVTHATRQSFAAFSIAACAAAAGYAWLLHRFTNSVSPIPDSLVLTFSVLGQLLLVRRQYRVLVVLAGGQHDCRPALRLARAVVDGRAVHRLLDQRTRRAP